MTATRMSDSARRGGDETPRDELGPEDEIGPRRLSSLVRILQDISGNASQRDPLIRVCPAFVAVWFFAAVGCGPIQTERPEARPPYINPDDTKPPQRVISISNDEERTLTVTPFDSNREEVLHAVWTDESNPLTPGTELLRQGTRAINKEKFFEYEAASIKIKPCQIADGGEKETIWVHVADRSFRTVSPGQNDVAVQEGGFAVSRSWVLSLATGVCP